MLSSVHTIGGLLLSVPILAARAPVNVRVSGRPAGEGPYWLLPAIMLPLVAVSAWQWWVLTRPAIRRRFVPHDYVDGPEPLLRADTRLHAR